MARMISYERLILGRVEFILSTVHSTEWQRGGAMAAYELLSEEGFSTDLMTDGTIRVLFQDYEADNLVELVSCL